MGEAVVGEGGDGGGIRKREREEGLTEVSVCGTVMAVRRREPQESKNLAVKEGRGEEMQGKEWKMCQGRREGSGGKKKIQEGERASERGERHPRVSVFWLAVTALSAQTAGGKQ